MSKVRHWAEGDPEPVDARWVRDSDGEEWAAPHSVDDAELCPFGRCRIEKLEHKLWHTVSSYDQETWKDILADDNWVKEIT